LLRVRPVRSAPDLKAFVALPYRLHAHDPSWVPPLRVEVRALLKKKGNAFFEFAQADYFLAERNGRVVGRIAAISNARHNEAWGDDVGFFGFFECEDDEAVARALLDEAAAWVRERGLRRLRGPASPSMNHECGLLVDGFDSPPAVMMAHNPPHYAKLIEAAGFSGVKDLWAYCGETAEKWVPLPERASRAARSLARRYGLETRRIDPRRFDEDIARIQRLYGAAWERNWGFVPMTDREIEQSARQFRPIYYPDVIQFANVGGETVGFGLALPDVNFVLRGNRQGRLLPVLPRLLWALKRRRIPRTRVLLLGVLPAWRGRGVDAVLWHAMWSGARDNGITWSEASWILDDNPGMVNAAERMGYRRYKTYRLYERPA
jgi:GNAT superfamily N-acetyltransferase